MNGLPEEKIQKIADTYTEGFRKGFELAKKPLDKKKSVQIRYPLGFERVVKAAIENFRKMGLEPVIARTPASFAEGRRGALTCRQQFFRVRLQLFTHFTRIADLETPVRYCKLE